jgi:DNA primase
MEMLGRAERAPELADESAAYIDSGVGPDAGAALQAERAEAEDEAEGHATTDPLTWRLAEAARARAAADRAADGDRAEFDLAPNGARLDRRERNAFSDLLRAIGHDGPGRDPEREK